MTRDQRLAAYRKHAANGLTMAQSADLIGVSRQAVHEAAKTHGIVFRLERGAKLETVKVPVPKHIYQLVSALADNRGAAFDYVLADLVTKGAEASL